MKSLKILLFIVIVAGGAIWIWSAMPDSQVADSRQLRAVQLSADAFAAADAVTTAPSLPLSGAADPLAGLPKSDFLARLEAALISAASVRTRGARDVEIFKQNAPGVVLIVTEAGSLGSGALISREEGLIITNWHVVSDRSRLGVIFKPAEGIEVDMDEMAVAQVLRANPEADLALLQVREIPDHAVALQLGTVEGLEVGADVHAIGHPTGEAWSYTKGIISQIRPDYEWNTREGGRYRATIIQTQTPINPGNSGGPLLDEEGRVVGLVSFTNAAAEGLHFAVSADDARRLVENPDAGVPSRVVDAGKPRPRPAGAKADCSRERRAIDRDGNGKNDAYLVDSNCDGKPDMLAEDADEDGRVERLLLDRNGDGEPDLEVIDKDRDGVLETYLADDDYDGSPDLLGIDLNGDGEIDKVRRI